jgi:hypothetical protein
MSGLCRRYVVNFFEMIRVLLGCLHVLFVQQYCESKVNDSCFIINNFNQINTVNIMVISFNFFTLGMFLYFYMIQHRRERYFEKYLEINKWLDNDTINVFLRSNATIANDIRVHNEKLYSIVKMLICTYVVNMIISACVIIGMYYDGVKTITTMFTNVFLISNRLYDLYEISKISVFGDQKAISTSTMVYACYNNVKMYNRSGF